MKAKDNKEQENLERFQPEESVPTATLRDKEKIVLNKRGRELLSKRWKKERIALAGGSIEICPWSCFKGENPPVVGGFTDIKKCLVAPALSSMRKRLSEGASILYFGPPGGGKTTHADLTAHVLGKFGYDYIKINGAKLAGRNTAQLVRTYLNGYVDNFLERSESTYLFIDECESLSARRDMSTTASQLEVRFWFKNLAKTKGSLYKIMATNNLSLIDEEIRNESMFLLYQRPVEFADIISMLKVIDKDLKEPGTIARTIQDEVDKRGLMMTARNLHLGVANARLFYGEDFKSVKAEDKAQMIWRRAGVLSSSESRANFERENSIEKELAKTHQEELLGDFEAALSQREIASKLAILTEQS